MLAVNDNDIKAASLHDHRAVNGAQLPDRKTQHQLADGELLLRRISQQMAHLGAGI